MDDKEFLKFASQALRQSHDLALRALEPHSQYPTSNPSQYGMQIFRSIRSSMETPATIKDVYLGISLPILLNILNKIYGWW